MNLHHSCLPWNDKNLQTTPKVDLHLSQFDHLLFDSDKQQVKVWIQSALHAEMKNAALFARHPIPTRVILNRKWQVCGFTLCGLNYNFVTCHIWKKQKTCQERKCQRSKSVHITTKLRITQDICSKYLNFGHNNNYTNPVTSLLSLLSLPSLSLSFCHTCLNPDVAVQGS